MPNPFNDGREMSEREALVRRLLDGQITPQEFDKLEAALKGDAAFRQRYLYLVDSEAALYEECSAPRSLQNTASKASPRTYSRRIGLSAFVAMTLCAAAGLLVWLFVSPPVPPALPGDAVPVAAAPVASESDIVFVQGEQVELPDAAILTRIDGMDLPGLKVGQRFKPGLLKFGKGRVQLDFLSGAHVVVAGPAELRIISQDAATLVSGTATAKIPKQALGFVFNSPDAAVVDLGTEFGLQVDESGASHVTVLEGEVEVSLLGDDGNTLISQHLDEREAVRVDKRGMEMAALADVPAAFPDFVPLDRSPLPVNDAYVRAVLESKPLVYWRFEAEENGFIRNEVDSRWWAKIVRPNIEKNGLAITNGYARFDESSKARLLLAEKPIPNLNNAGSSIEFWLKPDRLSHMACVSVIPEGGKGMNHLNVIEVAGKTRLIHKRDSIRFLHRYPPAENPDVGTNLFASGDCTPEQWQHVVAVKRTDALELYSNGKLARRFELEMPADTALYQVYLGQLRVEHPSRQFVGAMDEFALYDRALTPAEIENHYRLIAREGLAQ